MAQPSAPDTARVPPALLIEQILDNAAAEGWTRRRTARAIAQAGPPPLDVERLARAMPESWEPFWTETGNEDARDGMKEVTFDRHAFAEAIAVEYARLGSQEEGAENG